jgi:hypothetical protein
VDASGEYLLPEDVGVAGVLCEFAEHLQLQGPHQAVATTLDDVIEGERSHGLPRQFTSLPMGGLDDAIVSLFVRLKERSGVVEMPISA